MSEVIYISIIILVSPALIHMKGINGDADLGPTHNLLRFIKQLLKSNTIQPGSVPTDNVIIA